MVNTNLITCTLCRNYFADPRQIPCSHSFCFDCISGRFDDETFLLICPKCEKLHQYNSREEFENRCMRDGFLASMVTQHKRNQSRASASSSGPLSRPSSSMSHISSMYGFVPIPMVSQENNSSFDQSCSERSTPSSVLPQAMNPILVAKCQSCNIRADLTVCIHCDKVICGKCLTEHQSVVNDNVKREWSVCKEKFEASNDRSNRFDTGQEECESKGHQLQAAIDQQGEKFIQTIHNSKNAYVDLIEKHRRTYKQFSAHEQVLDEYESIDKRVNELLRSADVTAERIDNFSFEIEHLESRLDQLNKLLDSNELKFPVLTLPEQIDHSLLFGTLSFQPFDASSTTQLHFKPDDDDYVYIEKPSYSRFDQITSLLPIPIESKKKLLWQLDYKSVPYYVRYYHNLLFVCDKYGYLSTYKLNRPNDFRQKPVFLREMKLFNETSSSTLADEDQTIIDSFVVYKFWIIVFKRKKNELHGTIYLFTHDGKLIPNGKCLHQHPSRELTIDITSNILWSLDQKQLCLFYYQLPDQNLLTNKIEDYFQTRYSHVQFAKPFAPKHISVNKHVIAVLDKNRQAVHVYDKRSRQEIYEHINHYNNTTHFCWDMALFSDNSLLIKLDETSTLKAGPSKHIYLQLDTTKQRHVIGMIEEIDAYGMIITPSDEILIGVRINTKGTLKCYV